MPKHVWRNTFVLQGRFDETGNGSVLGQDVFESRSRQRLPTCIREDLRARRLPALSDPRSNGSRRLLPERQEALAATLSAHPNRWLRVKCHVVHDQADQLGDAQTGCERYVQHGSIADSIASNGAGGVKKSLGFGKRQMRDESFVGLLQRDGKDPPSLFQARGVSVFEEPRK
jgi:hypothetical protein